MFKLTVVAGPNRGTTYAVREGETTIGRQAGNVIVLESSKVSKRHCQLVVNGDRVTLEDLGSANGVFVNGTLARSREINPGDRISVGDFVFELSLPKKKSKAGPVAGFGQLVSFPSKSSAHIQRSYPVVQLEGQVRSPRPAFSASAYAPRPQFITPELGVGTPAGAFDTKPSGPPADLKGKLLWVLDYKIMPFFYGLNTKHEWRILLGGIVALMVFTNIFLAINPVLDSTRDVVVKELKNRASLIARQIRDRNMESIQSRNESKADIGTLEKEYGVRVAVLVDMDLRIIAPSTRNNQYLVAGREALAARSAAMNFKNRRERAFYKESGIPLGNTIEIGGGVVMAVEPLRIYNQRTGDLKVEAMAVASIDGRLSIPDSGDIGMVYSNAMIANGILTLLVLIILYKLTLHPLRALNDDLDKALKGEASQVKSEYQMSELKPLWDSINVAIQRAASADPMMSTGMGGGASTPAAQAEEYVGALRSMAEICDAGLLVLDSDRRVVHINPKFEEISGIRQESAAGQDIPTAARDQAFIALCGDLFERATPGAGVSDIFEFSGSSFRVQVLAFGPDQGAIKCLVMLAVANA